jgi:Uma2 family endonuclease
MAMHEIVLPETKPETEWVRGRALQKVSPTYDHAVLQRLLATRIGAWADDGAHGRVGTEWRFRIAPPGEIVRPLVPDVGYISYADLPADMPREAIQVPLATPTVAVEILSPDDRKPDVDDKVATYLRAGTSAIVVVDPHWETITVYDGATITLRAGDILSHASMPGFTLDVADLFAKAKR